MGRAKSRTAEITLRVRIPKGATLAQVRRAVADQWYGEIDGQGYMEPNRRGNYPQLKPTWGAARLAKRRAL